MPSNSDKPDNSGQTEVSFKFPKGMDPKAIEVVMAQVGRLTKANAEASTSIEKGRQVYIDQCKERTVCTVHSLRKGWIDFEMTISNPKNDAPIPVRGLCGVRLEEGLTRFEIDRLNQAHDYETTQGRSMTIDQILAVDTAIVMDTKKVKQYHYRVDEHGPVKNPKIVGQKIGKLALVKA